MAEPLPTGAVGQGRAWRIGFAGTPDYAALHLQALLDASGQHPWLKPALVLSQPDRARGRGQDVSRSPVAALADDHGIPVQTPAKLRGHDDDAQAARQALADARLDILVVVAYGLLLPAEVLLLPSRGCLNLHASLLPRWRGAAPIQRALMAGDGSTGVCLMQMDEGLDTGPVWASASTPIAPTDNVQTLHDRLAAMGSALLIGHLLETSAASPQLLEGWKPKAQSADGATYAAKILKADRQVSLNADAGPLASHIRGLDPSPGAELPSGIKAGGAVVIEAQGQWAPPGTVVRLPRSEQEPLVVACGRGLLGLAWLQRPGGKRLSAAQFCRGTSINEGSLL